MIQIQYSELIKNADYRSQVQEDFRVNFDNIQEPELNLAVSAYCFVLAIPQPQNDIQLDNGGLVFFQFMH